MEEGQILHILWASGEAETAKHMLMMYATNGMLYGWWDEIVVIIWGASDRLVVENEEIREYIRIAQRAGVKFSACIACARQFGVQEKFAELDIEVIPWGGPLTDILQSGSPLLTI